MKITPEEIANAHHEHCPAEHHCYGCKYHGNVKCAFTFSLDYIAKKSLEKVDAQALKSLEKVATDTNVGRKNGKDTNVPTKLPKWCKVGQWIISKAELKLHQSVEACSLKQIDDVDLDGHILFKKRTGVRVSGYWKEFVPIRFRPYNYEEAVGLLGKVIERKGAGLNAIETVGRVMQNSNGRLIINGNSIHEWMSYNATIDGLPIGVPVVDEEAMKGGEE